MKVIFWLSLGLIVYTYAGYPLVLYVLSRIAPKRVKRGDVSPALSIIIAAYNEESNIRSKLLNTLNLKYDGEREVIVVSDGSTDRTDEIVAEFQGPDVRLIRLHERSGKSIALNEGVKAARGDILVFTDAGAIAEDDCLRELISNFADPSVGCVSTEDVIVTVGNGSSEGAYVKYEMFLRQLESKAGSCVAVSGSFYAIRKELCPVFPPQSATDLLSAAETVKRGYRTISDSMARARLGTVSSQQDEFRRKVRTVLTGVACLPDILPLMNPVRYPLCSLELFSHKLLRWFGGFVLISLLLSNLMLIGQPVFRFIFTAQVLFYLPAILGALSEKISNRFLIVRLPYFFASTNISALVAVIKYAAGNRVAVWQPSKRQIEEITV